MLKLTDKRWSEYGRKKAVAVAVLAEVWAGATLPQQLIEHAQAIEQEMRVNGTWMLA